MSFNKYFHDELSTIRELGREFAERNPRLAPFLTADGQDPDVERLLEGNPTVQGTAPRWLGLGRVANTDNPLLNTSVVLLVLDSEAEEKAKIGEAWGRRPLGEQETYIVRVGILEKNY